MTDNTLSTYRVMTLGAAVEAGMDTMYTDFECAYTAAVLEASDGWMPANRRPVTDYSRDVLVIARPPRPKTLTITMGEDTLLAIAATMRRHGYEHTADKLDAAIEAAQ